MELWNLNKVGIALIALLVVTLVDTYSVKKEDTKTRFELDDFLNSTYSAKSFNGSWISDSEILYKSIDGDVMKFDALSEKNEIFLEKAVLDQYNGASIKLSEDHKYVLIEYDTSSVFRHSTTSKFAVYDIAEKLDYKLHNEELLQYATFDPSGHGIAYVYKNNIYYLANPTEATNPKQITTDGEPNIVYNGVPDWVYEEEVLASGSALWFSPDGNKIAFAQFSDKKVQDFTYIIYGNDLYPKPVTIKYPKVGTINPTVKLFLYDLESSTLIKPAIEPENEEDDYILYDVTWVSDTEVALISTNRVQNKSVTTRCKLDGKCEQEDDEIHKSENGWLDPEIPEYSIDGSKKIEILPQSEGNDFFDHLVLTDIAKKTSKRLTKGRRVVTDIYGWDEDSDTIYYGGTVEDFPYQQQIYSIKTDGSSDTCLSCDVEVNGEKCTYAAAAFSKELSYMIIVCRGPNPTKVVVKNMKDLKEYIWEDNSELLEKLAQKETLGVINLEVPVANGFNARVRILTPEDFDSNKKYPAIVNVYAGPNSNQISDAWTFGFQNYLVSGKKYLYIYIDGRGSGKDGRNKLFQVYRNLATAEIEDQIAVTKYLQEKYAFIDRNNTAIWGWSYGGFATAWTLVKDKENVFKCGISVAPVTSFIYYDSIYTERYMGLPVDDNAVGYNNTDLTKQVEGFRNKTFYLIHGNADDNVHYQQSMVLSSALEQADILFQQQSYPDENHSLTHVKNHLYHSMDQFWNRCFATAIEREVLKENSNSI
ncbi:venom dipeptidyl peptidase 4 isoform X2 [Aethina tumida]|uniref:venom dipeptidyl peptidase 4 isoform X2 n=1 Tax=Aethina tumida TaxID=116153 RepID=UPI00096B3321|nr:venom dipeptidyl peptidase 4 isoform X2 [Aethina tumida]